MYKLEATGETRGKRGGRMFDPCGVEFLSFYISCSSPPRRRRRRGG